MQRTTVTYDRPPTVWVLFSSLPADESATLLASQAQSFSEILEQEDANNERIRLRSESFQQALTEVDGIFHQLADGFSTPLTDPPTKGFQHYRPETADVRLNPVMCYEVRLIDILCDFLDVYIKACPILEKSERTELFPDIERVTCHSDKIDEESLGFFFQFIAPNYDRNGKIAFTSEHLPLLRKLLLSKKENLVRFAEFLITKLETTIYSRQLGNISFNCINLLTDFNNYIKERPELLKISNKFNSILRINRLLGDYFLEAGRNPDEEFLSDSTLIEQLTPILRLWMNQRLERETFYLAFKKNVFKNRRTLKDLYKTMYQEFAITREKSDKNYIPREKITNYQTYLDDCQTLYGRIRQILPEEDFQAQKLPKTSTSESVVTPKKKAPPKRKTGHKKKTLSHKKITPFSVPRSPVMTSSDSLASSSMTSLSIAAIASSSDHFESALGRTESSSSFACSSIPPPSSSSIAPSPENEFISPATQLTVKEIREVVVPYPFSHRVIDMLNDSPEMLQQGDYADLSEREKRRQHLLHGFSQVVDSYIGTHALETTWENRTTGHLDRVHFIPGQIKWEGERMSGVFNFTVGRDGRVYHRFFSRRPVQELVNLALNSFRNIDFPTLEQANQLESQRDPLSPPVQTNALYGETVRQHRIYNSIHIKDPRHKATLILYPKSKIGI